MNNINTKEIIIFFLIFNILAIIACIYLVNFIFIEWQKLPSNLLSYNTILLYETKYGHIPAVAKAISISKLAGVVAWLLMNVFLAVALFAKPKKELHGSARFANDREIKKTKLILSPTERKKQKQPSIIVGKYKDKLLEFYGNQFAFVSAPTRSGKGVAIVIPNLLHYPHSCVVLDVKNENWDLTAGFRGKYQDVYLFAPSARDKCSHRYNPLDYISRDETKRMSEVQNLANIMYPTTGVDGNTAYFNSMAQSLLTGIILYMMETPDRPCTFAEALRLLRPAEPLNEWILAKIKERNEQKLEITDLKTGETKARPLTSECVEALMTFAGNSSDNTRAGISSSCIAPLLIFADPMVASATSASDFRLDEVRKKKMTIYVGIQPNELARFDKLLNLLFSQLLNINTSVLPEQDPELKYQCLVLLDEFTALGRVEIIQKSVAYMAGYNMRLLLIFQSKSQVEDVYGKDGAKSIFANMACQVMYRPSEQEEAEEYSRMLGTYTVKSKSTSKNRGKGGGGSVSISDQSRALMLPQELKEMEQNQEIVVMTGTGIKPILAEKAFYYEFPSFEDRMTKVKATPGDPAQGLPIDKKHKPPLLNVQEMLSIMRNEKKLQGEGLKPENLENSHPEYVEQCEQALIGDFLESVGGFDDELDKRMKHSLEQELINYHNADNTDNTVVAEINHPEDEPLPF